MKLTNPTDDELNYAFAVHVAKWTHTEPLHPARPGARWWSDENGSLVDSSCDPDSNIFTASADAVLPWLEKRTVASINWILPDGGPSGWRVDIYASIDDASLNKGVGALDKSFPRAAVIALLRAHGVEVETP